MRRSHAHPLLTGAITAVVLLALMVGIVVLGVPGGPQVHLPWDRTETLHVQLQNSDELAPHASVQIAGVKVGEVQNVVLHGNVAVATLTVQQRYDSVRTNAVVYLRAHGLFGPKYVSIVPGSAPAPLVPDGGTISVSRIVEPVNLDAILQALQAPEQQDLRTAIVELGTAAAGRGDDVNHLLVAADSFTKVLDTPLRAVGGVGPQLSDMLVRDEAFNSAFAQAPLDQLVANSESTFAAFAANASHLQSLLTDADTTLTQLDTALNGEPGNLATIIQQLGTPGGTVDRLDKLTYLLSLFGANFTGAEAQLGSDKADQNVTTGIVGAITNIASALRYSDVCPPSTGAPGSVNDDHCSLSPDGRYHYLDANLYNFPPSSAPNPAIGVSWQAGPGPLQSAGGQLSGFEALLAS